MLALLKPWRDLRHLKTEYESWESAFTMFIEHVTQRDKDVVAGSQYYYDSRNVSTNRNINEEKEDDDVNEQDDGYDAETDVEDESTIISVSAFHFFSEY